VGREPLPKERGGGGGGCTEVSGGWLGTELVLIYLGEKGKKKRGGVGAHDAGEGQSKQTARGTTNAAVRRGVGLDTEIHREGGGKRIV